MSLTTELKAKSEIESLGRLFRRELPNSKKLVTACNRQLSRGITIKPETTKGYPASLVGAAVDYKLRILLDYTDPGDLVASKAPLYIALSEGDEAVENLSRRGRGPYKVTEIFF